MGKKIAFKQLYDSYFLSILTQIYNNSLINMQEFKLIQQFPETQQDAIQSLPSQKYLQRVLKSLEIRKYSTTYPTIPVGTIFKGFKTIPIQKLQFIDVMEPSKKTGEYLWRTGQVYDVFHYEESCHLSKQYANGFFGAFYEAYKYHGDVKITPDDVWTAIMLYFSKYVDQNAEQLREAFVSHEGKTKLVVETTQELQETQWNQFFENVLISIKEKTTKGITERLQCSFSTTDQFFRFFSTAIIMNSYKKYFEYERGIQVCGIQNIHMGGVLEDWVKVYQRLSSLSEFDVDGRLKMYVERLKPVIDQFIETYKGQANIEFWNNIYHERQNPQSRFYDPQFYANGWILRFFTLSDIIKERMHMEEIDVPIKINNKVRNTIKDVSLVGGCRGISVENNVYRPYYSFAIVQKKKDVKQNVCSQQQVEHQKAENSEDEQHEVLQNEND